MLTAFSIPRFFILEWNTCRNSSDSSSITNHIAAGEDSTAIEQHSERHILDEEVTAASVFPETFNEEPVDTLTPVQSLISALSARLGEGDVTAMSMSALLMSNR